MLRPSLWSLSLIFHHLIIIIFFLVGWDHGTLKEELTSSAVCKVKKKPGSTLCSSVEVTIGGDTVYVGEIPQNPQCRTFIAIRSKNKKKPSHSKVILIISYWEKTTHD